MMEIKLTREEKRMIRKKVIEIATELFELREQSGLKSIEISVEGIYTTSALVVEKNKVYFRETTEYGDDIIAKRTISGKVVPGYLTTANTCLEFINNYVNEYKERLVDEASKGQVKRIESLASVCSHDNIISNIDIISSSGNINLTTTCDEQEIEDAKMSGKLIDSSSSLISTSNKDLDLVLDARMNLAVTLKTINRNITVSNFQGSALSVKTSNGKIKITNCISNDLDLNSANGKIKIKNIVAKNMNTNTVNGNIIVNDTLIENASITGNNGFISVEDCAASDTLSLHTIHGNITCTNTTAKHYLAKTKSGNIRLIRTAFDESDISSKSGKIYESISEGDYINTHGDGSIPTIEYIKKR